MNDKKDPKINLKTPHESNLIPLPKLDASLFEAARRRRDARRRKPDQVKLDALSKAGNALHPQQDARMSAEDNHSIHTPTLSNLAIVEDAPPPDLKTIAVNRVGIRVGYNPYDSGKLEKTEWKKPRDLRALSQWIEATKKTKTNPT